MEVFYGLLIPFMGTVSSTFPGINILPALPYFLLFVAEIMIYAVVDKFDCSIVNWNLFQYCNYRCDNGFCTDDGVGYGIGIRN